jgi:hypothetical protein
VYKDEGNGFGENGERSRGTREKKNMANAGFRSEKRHGRGWGDGGGVHIGQTKPEADEVCHSEIDAIPDEVGQRQFGLGSFVIIRMGWGVRH